MASASSSSAPLSVSSAPSSSKTPAAPYDVFLSFRGKDTRNNFTSHLYAALDRHGVRTFMDDPELRTGEVISSALMKAIKESKSYIVIFSEDYASSSWCLNELVEICDCHQKLDRIIVGVYHHIEPTNVRYQTGSFEEHFENHKKKYGGEVDKVTNWRRILKEVADISGTHVTAGRKESEIIDEIVDVILLEIKPKILHVADHPVGLESHFKDLTTLLSNYPEEGGVIKFGLYGMGGVGKTTLAKALYNQLLEMAAPSLDWFKGSCFLAEVRETSKTKKGLVSLQQQLLDEVLKSRKKVKVHNVEEGKKFISERICSAKVLVLIDDVDDFGHYRSLIGPFAPRSVVIITTRNVDMLVKADVKPGRYRYNVNVLDDVKSRALFTQYAFGKAEPENKFVVLIEDILHLARGLPLALMIFGSYLSNLSEERWKDYIEKLQKNPNSDIEEKLSISLDSLRSDGPMLKEMFLDIACFFIGRKKEEVVEIMKAYYKSSADVNIDILKNRCLLTMNTKNELGMHDLLRDVGRKVARGNYHDENDNEDNENAGKYSRLWAPKDICYVLNNKRGTTAIQGIIPANFYYPDALEGVTFPAETFQNMSELKFLYLKNATLSGDFKQTFANLRWFCWDYCPLEGLPSNFCPPKLVILALRSSKLKKIQDLNMEQQVFQRLGTLDMSYSLHLTTSPDFTKLLLLKTLTLKGCESLEEVDISIGSLKHLVSINLGACVNLKSLPNSICNLGALESLTISGCSSLEALPTELGNIDSLKELHAENLTVSELPNSIGRLSKLVDLRLSGNKNLKTLPDTICNLRALKSLNIGGCSSLKALPVEMGNIENLTRLDAWGLTVLSLPDSIRRLGKLLELNLSESEYSFASTSPPTVWDVFLSFHTPNTRNNFTRHLYDELNGNYIRTFMESPELRVNSDTYIQAIKESEIYIVVFSKNYAISHWCLDELLEILKCRNSMKRLVIPVFYNIDATVVQYQTESFGKAFEAHQVRFSGEKLKQWRLALRKVARFPGYHISQNSAAYDTISQVVDRVSVEMKSRTLYVAHYPIRLYYRVKCITALLSSGIEGVTKIGIYGMGGVGKTTLAKALFKQLSQEGSFRHTCFLPDVREVFQTAQGPLIFQQKLIKEKVKVNNVEQGTNFIRGGVCSTKVLVLIDDIDKPEQYRSLVGPFASGSVVIITTRNEEILDEIGVETKYRYRVSELDYAESLALFTQNAFRNDKRHNILMELSKDIVHLAGGIPLALQVFGSILYGKSRLIWEWEWFIEKLKQLPSDIVTKSLLISFNELKLVDPMLQDFFLDIAYFFIGRKKEEVVKILKTYYLNVDRKINALHKRCLVITNNRGELSMNDLLRDMGRKIVRDKSPDKPGKLSRLSEAKDICYVLTKYKGTEAIEGIVYQDALEEKSFTTKAFKRMRKLRFLSLENVHLTGSFEQKFEDLRWLCWDCCPLKCLPPEFYPQNLVILELPNSKIRSLWELHMGSQVFKKLKTLNMKYSKVLTTAPDFTKLPCLENLVLEGCESLVELHVSVGSLENLVSLNLQGCVKLKGLPNTICNLKALEVLSINGCSSLEALPIELGKIGSLRELNVNALTVSKLPDSITCLSKLAELRLSYNKNLENLPDTICNMGSVITLDLRDCSHLLEIAEVPPNLKWIRADGCKTMTSLPNLSNLRLLEMLDLKDCISLKGIQGLEELNSLRELHLEGCNSALMANTLTESLFQMFSGFGHSIRIYSTAVEFPAWITQSPNWIGQSSEYESTLSLDLQPNVSHDFLGMILCFKHMAVTSNGEATFSVKNTTSGFTWGGSFNSNYTGANIVIVPRSIFSVEDGDDRIELTADAEILGIHLLHSTEMTMVDGERRWHPSKWLKLLGARPFWQKSLICLCIYVLTKKLKR